MDLTGFRESALMAMRQHELDDWSFQWDRAKARAGQCRFKQRVISMSRPLAERWAPAEVWETLLHEIAHALAGPKAGHGPEWKRVAVSIGARPERCAPVGEDTPAIEGRYRGACPAGHVIYRHRLTPRAQRSSCFQCSPYYDARNAITWTDTQAPVMTFDFSPRKPGPAKRKVTFTW